MSKRSSVEEQIASGKPFVFFTMGISMQPLLYERSTHVIINKVEKPLQRKDIALYKAQNGKLVLHRIIGMDEKYYYFRGDNLYWTEKVPKKWVIGVVTKIYRKGKYIEPNSLKYRMYVNLLLIVFPLRFFVYRHKQMRGEKHNG